jgi:hypothetical protein
LDAISVWFGISSIFLAFVLFKPANKFIFVQRVRKAERKLKRDLTEEEREDHKKKSVPITAIIVITFAILFNSVIMGKYFK